MFSINRTQIICFAGGIALFVIGLFFKTDVTAMLVSFMCGFVFVGAGYFVRSKPVPYQPETIEEEAPLFPEHQTPKPTETQPPPQASPLTLQDQLGNILDNYFQTAHVKGKVTLKLNLPTEIDYKGLKVAVNSDLEVELDGSKQQAQPNPIQPPAPKTVEYKPIED